MIKTERLILRQWQKEDLAPFADLNADPEVRRYFLSILSKKESDELAEEIAKEIDSKNFGLWAVSLPGISDFIGFIGLHEVEPNFPFSTEEKPAIEIGWRLAKPFWNQGFATEGALACLDYAFNILNIPEIVAFTVLDNIPSQNVMHKIGMTYDSQFSHPKVPLDHPYNKHLLFKIKNPTLSIP